MKIYYFVHVTGTDPGMSGIPRVVKSLGHELVEREDFELVPVSWSKRLGAIVHSEQKLLDNLARHSGPALRESNRAREPIEPESGAWLLIPEAPHLGSNDPDYPSILINEPIGYARRCGLQVAAVFHDIMPLTHQLQRRAFVDMGLGARASGDGELTRLRFTVYAHALALTDIVLPVSQTTGRLLFQWLVRHGHPAESLPTFSPILLPEEVLGTRRVLPHRSARDDAGCKGFITVGTVCTHKNQLAAIAAFQRLTERRPELDIRFHVVGSMAPEAAVPAGLLAKRSKGRIVLHGFLQDQEIEALAERAHATVFVSLAEGYGMPAAESLWRGKPCLCSNEGSIAEIAEGGGCLTVNPRSLEEIEAGFEGLVTDTALYDQLLLQIAEREMKSWKTYADEVAQQLGAERIFSRPRRRRAPKPPLVASRKSDGQPVDETAETALFMLSASDLEVPGAYVSGRADPIRRKGAIWFERAKDGDVDEDVLFFGPYIWLPPGRYDFRFEGELEGELELDFTADEGKRKLGRATVSGFGNAVTIDVPDEVEKFEIVGRRTPRLERLIFRNAFAEYRSLAGAPPETDASAEVGLDSGPGGEAAIDTAAAGSPTAPEPAVATAAAGSPPTAPETAADVAPSGSPPTVPETPAVHGDDLAAIRVPPTAERIVFIRHENGRAMRLPCVIAAQEMRVHDAFGLGARNRLRSAKNIAFDAAAHGEIDELCLFFGPYLRLEPGDYSFFFHGELQGRLKLRLTQKFASDTLLETVLSTFDQPVHLRLEASAEKFEIIGDRTKDTRSMTLHAIEVTPAELCNQRAGVAESTATEPRAPAQREASVAAREHEGMAPSSRRGWREKIPFPLRT